MSILKIKTYIVQDRNVQDETQRDRLRKLVSLANFLDDLPHSKFYMPQWGDDDSTVTSCGTAGCAAGWAVNKFHKDGFIFNNMGVPIYNNMPFLNDNELLDTKEDSFYVVNISFAYFFGISFIDAFHITCNLYKNICFFQSVNIMMSPVVQEEYWRDPLFFLSYEAEYDVKAIHITSSMAADRIRKVVARYDRSLLDEKRLPEQILAEVCH